MLDEARPGDPETLRTLGTVAVMITITIIIIITVGKH